MSNLKKYLSEILLALGVFAIVVAGVGFSSVNTTALTDDGLCFQCSYDTECYVANTGFQNCYQDRPCLSCATDCGLNSPCGSGEGEEQN